MKQAFKNLFHLGGRGRKVDREAVIWAYRIFLERDPENMQVVEEKANRLNSMTDLRRDMMESGEYHALTGTRHFATLTGDEPPMQIVPIQSEANLQQLFQHIQDTWRSLGESEPYWSVLSENQFEKANIEKNKEAFYQSGQLEVENIFKTLKRIGIDTAAYSTCLEYGCGLGRVTHWLARRFQVVYGADISSSHLKYADEFYRQHGIENIRSIHVQNVRDTRDFPKVDFIYSRIVLQHNPPAIIEAIVEDFLHALNPGGVAFFQVPTYRLGYKFSNGRKHAKCGTKKGNRDARPASTCHSFPCAETRLFGM